MQMSSGSDLANVEAVRHVRDLARKMKVPALAQLASRMSSAIKLGSASGGDVFAKVKEGWAIPKLLFRCLWWC